MDGLPIEVEGIDHVALGVTDQERSVEWYRSLLGRERAFEGSWGDVPAMLIGRAGTSLALFRTRDGDARPGFRHVAFRVSREQYERAKDVLAAEGIPFEEQDHSVAWSVYFSDPDGIPLELTTYEPVRDGRPHFATDARPPAAPLRSRCP